MVSSQDSTNVLLSFGSSVFEHSHFMALLHPLQIVTSKWHVCVSVGDNTLFACALQGACMFEDGGGGVMGGGDG